MLLIAAGGDAEILAMIAFTRSWGLEDEITGRLR